MKSAAPIESRPRVSRRTPPSPRAAFLLSIGLLAALTVAMFGPVLFTAKDLVPAAADTDLAFQYIHWRAFGFGELAQGHFPLWNPHLFGGNPFFGGFQAALLYPPNLIFLLLPLAKAVSWSVALHVFLGGLFTYLWVLRRGLHPFAALVSAVTVMFCGAHFLHVYAGHLTHLCTMIWAPLVFTSIDGLLEGSNRLGWQLLGMFAVAMQIFAGYPQYVYFTGVAAMFYAACCSVRCSNRTRFLLGVCCLYVGGALLGAVQLFTGWDDWREMSRGSGIAYEASVSFSLPPENLLTSFAPGFFGDIVHSTYWGRRYLWEASIFIGAVTLCLAALGATAADKKVRRFSVTMVWVFALLALGGHTPIYKVLYNTVPALNKFRAPSKFALIASLFIAMLAAIGVNDLLRGRKPSRKFIMAVGAISAVLFGGAAIIYTSSSFWHSVLSAIVATREYYLDPNTYESPRFIAESATAAAWSLVIAAVTFGATALLLEWHRRLRNDPSGSSKNYLSLPLFAGTSATIPLVLIICLASAESWYLASRTFASFSVSANASPTLKRIVQSDPGDYRILNLDAPNEAMTMGARDVWGYDAAIPSRHAQVMALTQGVNPDLFPSYIDVTNWTSPLFAMFRCKYVVPDRTSKDPVQTLTNCLPHALLVPNYRVIPNRDEMFGALLNPAFDPRAEVLLESSPAGFSLQPLIGLPSPEIASLGTVKIENETTDTLTIDANVQSPAVLLVTDNYARNWHIRSLGTSVQRDYQVMPANHCLRAVPLEAGHHRFRMEYSPMGFRLGKWVSAAAALLYMAAVVWCVIPVWRNRKRT